MKQYQKAIDSVKEALDIQRETLPRKHPEIAITFYNMGIIYKELHDYNQAYDNYIKAAEIFSETHPYIRRALEALCRIELKIKQMSV
jgi:tetratricopeptide (TPR) repeat protein